MQREKSGFDEFGLLTLNNFVLPIDLYVQSKKGIKGLLNNRGWSQSLDWFPPCLSFSLLLSLSLPLLFNLISG